MRIISDLDTIPSTSCYPGADNVLRTDQTLTSEAADYEYVIFTILQFDENEMKKSIAQPLALINVLHFQSV